MIVSDFLKGHWDICHKNFKGNVHQGFGITAFQYLPDNLQEMWNTQSMYKTRVFDFIDLNVLA